MQIQVKLDTTQNPPVTVIPKVQPVDHGNQTIEWTPFANQDFEFTSLTFANNPSVFSTPAVGASQISVQDNNQNTGPAVEYPYTIVVTSNGVQYSSAKSKLTGDEGSPTIKNH